MHNPDKRWLSEKKYCFWLFWQLKKPSARKLLLYACACHRRIWDLLDEQCRAAAELVERRAEGLASAGEVAETHRRFKSLLMRLQYQLQVVENPWEDLEEDEEYEPTDEQMEEHARAVREAAIPQMSYYAALAVNHGLCKPTIERAQGAGGCASGVITQRLVAAGKDPTRAEAAQE